MLFSAMLLYNSSFQKIIALRASQNAPGSTNFLNFLLMRSGRIKGALRANYKAVDVEMDDFWPLKRCLTHFPGLDLLHSFTACLLL
jgi:hypothetical protein